MQRPRTAHRLHLRAMALPARMARTGNRVRFRPRQPGVVSHGRKSWNKHFVSRTKAPATTTPTKQPPATAPGSEATSGRPSTRRADEQPGSAPSQVGFMSEMKHSLEGEHIGPSGDTIRDPRRLLRGGLPQRLQAVLQSARRHSLKEGCHLTTEPHMLYFRENQRSALRVNFCSNGGLTRNG